LIVISAGQNRQPEGPKPDSGEHHKAGGVGLLIPPAASLMLGERNSAHLGSKTTYVLLDDLTFKQTARNTDKWLLDECIGLFATIDRDNGA
jgi:hypothetical protein